MWYGSTSADEQRQFEDCGVSRSATFAIAYLMNYFGLPMHTILPLQMNRDSLKAIVQFYLYRCPHSIGEIFLPAIALAATDLDGDLLENYVRM